MSYRLKPSLERKIFSLSTNRIFFIPQNFPHLWLAALNLLPNEKYMRKLMLLFTWMLKYSKVLSDKYVKIMFQKYQTLSGF